MSFSDLKLFALSSNNHDFVSPDISKDSQDYKHGTAVTSLIVDGANLNPNLDDGCGNFRVRHFG
ncbi:hypothetical protein K8353_41935, partial [Burkholderia contaminans]|nr:hypothetical protein [Burkholderia contaminans]